MKSNFDSNPMAASPPSVFIARLHQITKAFASTVAVDHVDLDLVRGEVHGLVGENGAGKSTLMRILAGFYPDYGGEIAVAGRPVRITGPRQARDLGIALVHQELSLVPEFSVAENIFLGREPYAAIPGFISRGRAEDEARRLLDDLRIDLPPRARISDLSVARRQLVEIAKGVAASPKILILDEPTSSLTSHEIGELFRVARTLTERGTTLVYISHKMDEVFALTDRVTVLRDGRLVATQGTADWTENALIRAMVGRDLSALYPRTGARIAETALELRGLSHRGRFHDVSLSVRRGEILGLYGLIGSGRTELAESIFALSPPDRGEISIGGRRVVMRTPQDALRHGLALIPEDRRGRGLVLFHSVRTNLSLRALRALSHFGFVDRRREAAASRRMCEALAIRLPSLAAAVAQLSGGNQQKVIIGKWLMVTPRILILDEPTRGIDVGAKGEVHAIIDRLAGEGMAVMLISSELPEVLRMSDRVLVMRRGRIVAEFARSDATEEALVTAAAAAEVDEGSAGGAA